uniref:G_PROTEIN_RECEP_F1_2 domain-containing protein n=2 Tax=Caenorhabditis japonica TaxID=281687 RepID=A0A8R1DEL0_CAEJA
MANLLVFVAARKMSSMSSSFGMITKNQAVCNTIMCLIFLLSVCPMQLTGSPWLLTYSHFFGAFAMTVYEVSNASHLLIALNRFCAVFLPSHYEILFTKRGTKALTYTIWCAATIVCILLYEIIGCHFTYDDVSWTFGFLATKMCTTLTWYSDFTFNTSLVVITLSVNLLTAYKAGRNSRMLMNAAGMKMSKTQRRRELNFVKQAFFQGTTIFTGQVSYYLFAPLVLNSILLFLLGTLWAFMHAVEGSLRLVVNYIALMMAGLDTMIFPFYTEYWSFLVFFVLFSIGVVWRYSGSRWNGMFRNRIFKSKIVRLWKATNDKRRTTNN